MSIVPAGEVVKLNGGGYNIFHWKYRKAKRFGGAPKTLPLEGKVSAKQTDEVATAQAAWVSAPKTLPLEGKVSGRRPDG